MDLLLIRHAIAEDRGTFADTGHPDSERPLTEDGADRMRRAATGLVATVPALDLVCTSPYRRARQTATIVAEAFGTEVFETDTLAPGTPPSAFAAWARSLDQRQRLAAVGHEPDLSDLAAWLAMGSDEPMFSFKKGGACLLSFARSIDAGTGELCWVLTPKLLRRLGRNPT